MIYYMKESLHEGTFMKIKGCAKKPLKQRKQPLKESYVCLYKKDNFNRSLVLIFKN